MSEKIIAKFNSSWLFGNLVAAKNDWLSNGESIEMTIPSRFY